MTLPYRLRVGVPHLLHDLASNATSTFFLFGPVLFFVSYCPLLTSFQLVFHSIFDRIVVIVVPFTCMSTFLVCMGLSPPPTLVFSLFVLPRDVIATD